MGDVTGMSAVAPIRSERPELAPAPELRPAPPAHARARDVTVLPLVLACSEDDEIELLRAFGSLRVDGFEPELVPGVDRDTRLFAEAIDATRGPGLFVIVRSRHFGRNRVDSLTGTFNARRGPNHRLVVTHFDHERPDDLSRSLSGPAVVLRRQDRPAKKESSDSPRNMRDRTGLVPNWIQTASAKSVPASVESVTERAAETAAETAAVGLPVFDPEASIARLQAFAAEDGADPDAPTMQDTVVDPRDPRRAASGPIWGLTGALLASAGLLLTDFVDARPVAADATAVSEPELADEPVASVPQEPLPAVAEASIERAPPAPLVPPSIEEAAAAPQAAPATVVENKPAKAPHVITVEGFWALPQKKSGLDWSDAANLCSTLR